MLLDRLPWPIVDGDALVGEMIKVLARDWWSRDPSSLVKIDHSAHMDMLAQLTSRLNPATAQLVYDLEDQIPWLSLAVARVHGEPLFTNTFVAVTGSYLLMMINDRPAIASVPDLVSVDYGMILLSAIGFDGNVWEPRAPITGAAKLQQLIDQRHGADAGQEKRAAKYWCIIHLLRMHKNLGFDDDKLIMLFAKAYNL